MKKLISLGTLTIFLSACVSNSLIESSSDRPASDKISILNEGIDFPADWIVLLSDAIERFKEEDLSLSCHTISLQSNNIEEESYEGDNGEWIEAEQKHYVLFYPDETPDVKIAESLNLFHIGITPQQRECGPGVTYVYDANGRFLYMGYERHQLQASDLMADE